MTVEVVGPYGPTGISPAAIKPVCGPGAFDHCYHLVRDRGSVLRLDSYVCCHCAGLAGGRVPVEPHGPFAP